jgi:nucleotidyltransferase/DNA polymerase involved in DNA repair
VRLPVNEVPGVGDVSANRLQEAGITDSLALSRLTEDRLVEVLSTPNGRAFPRARAAEILREARKLSGRT